MGRCDGAGARCVIFFFSSRRRHTRLRRDWSSDVCSSDLYRIDDFQPTYFVIPSLEELLEASLQDFAPIYRQLETLDDIPIGELAAQDAVIHRGDQTYHRSRLAAQ